MGRKKTANDYRDLITVSYYKLYLAGIEDNIERVQLEKTLKRQLKSWSDLVMVVVYIPGNEQNPWTFDELGYGVKKMELKKDSGHDQVGDYHVKVCTQEAIGDLPAIWKYLDVIVERKGGVRTKKSVCQFNWDAVVQTNHYSYLIGFLYNEFEVSFEEEDINIINPTTVSIVNFDTSVNLSLSDDYKTLVATCIGYDIKKYTARKVKGNRNIYKTVYSPGKGGPHDLYGSLYGSTTLKDGTVRSNRDRLHDEIKRFKDDNRFNKLWLFAECSRSDFMNYRPIFKGKARNKGFGANVESRKASILSIGYEIGSPINWCGSRIGAIDDFKNMVTQTIMHDYVRLLDLP